MNIEFKVTVKSFLDAAQIQEVLDKQDIKYSMSGVISDTPNKKRVKRRGKVTKKIVAEVKLRADELNVPELVKEFDLSRSTIDRILSNAHTLQVS